jgi:hypothetical protein
LFPAPRADAVVVNTALQIASHIALHSALHSALHITPAARQLGLARQTVWERVRRSKYLQDVVAEIDEGLIAKAQDNVTKAIYAGDMQTSRWYLERKGRHLGYGTKVEASVDTAQIERVADAIISAGPAAIRAVRAVIAERYG